MKIYLIIGIALVFLSLSVSASHLTELQICDDLGGTRLVLDRTTVCYDGPDVDRLSDDILVVVSSTEQLNRVNQRPYTNQFVDEPSITFLYDQPAAGQPKVVRLILTSDITEEPTELSLGVMADNMLKGYGYMVILDGEYYLFSHPTEVDLFAAESLTLTHIPTKAQYTAVNYAGTNWYLFTVLGGRQVAAGAFSDLFVINALNPGEAPAAYVVPQNLTEKYEVTFKFTEPVSITDPVDPSIGVLTICQDDNPRDLQQVQVCRNDVLEVTLQSGKLTRRLIGGTDYAFIFEVVNNVKQVSIFTLQNLDGNEERDPAELDYNNFIDNVVEGRRIALEFKDTLYLLGHPVADFISLPSLTVTAFTTEGASQFTAAGSEGKVEFSTVDGGKFFLKRNYGDPPPPFDLWALEQQELQPVNLDDDLFTSLTSLGAVTITTPSLGTVQVRDADISFSSAVFKLASTTAGTTENIDLTFQEPQEISGSALFYYHTANINQGIPVKSVSIYRFYDVLSQPPPPQQQNLRIRDYDDNFISTFTAGNQMALKFEDSYYLLGHNNPANEPAFFDVSKLALTTLDGSQSFPPAVESPSEASFLVPEGKITVTINDATSTMIFSATTRATLETLALADEDYSIALTTTNNINVNGIVLEMCNLALYQSVTAASICFNGQEVLISPSTLLVINKEQYLLEVNGETGDLKQVTLRRIIHISDAVPEYAVVDWNEFAQHLLEGDYPLFKIADTFYLPLAANNLLTGFQLQEYPDGEVFSLRNLQQETPVSYNGSMVFLDQIVGMNQEITGLAAARKISTKFTLQSYRYLPDDGTSLAMEEPDHSRRFITSLTGSVYTLAWLSQSKDVDLVRLRLGQEIPTAGVPAVDILIDRWFAVGETKRLTVDGVPVEITVEEEETPTPGIFVHIARVT